MCYLNQEFNLKRLLKINGIWIISRRSIFGDVRNELVVPMANSQTPLKLMFSDYIIMVLWIYLVITISIPLIQFDEYKDEVRTSLVDEEIFWFLNDMINIRGELSNEH